jgi:PRTRC genetic system protein C
MTEEIHSKRTIKYGDKEFALDDGMTIDQAKSIMARHFPELADPEVKTGQTGDATTYTFTKKAGRKGAQADVDALLAIPATAVLPDDILRIATALLGDDAETSDADGRTSVEGLHQTVREVRRVTAALADMMPSVQPAGGMLL